MNHSPVDFFSSTALTHQQHGNVCASYLFNQGIQALDNLRAATHKHSIRVQRCGCVTEERTHVLGIKKQLPFQFKRSYLGGGLLLIPLISIGYIYSGSDIVLDNLSGSPKFMPISAIYLPSSRHYDRGSVLQQPCMQQGCRVRWPSGIPERRSTSQGVKCDAGLQPCRKKN